MWLVAGHVSNRSYSFHLQRSTLLNLAKARERNEKWTGENLILIGQEECYQSSPVTSLETCAPCCTTFSVLPRGAFKVKALSGGTELWGVESIPNPGSVV